MRGNAQAWWLVGAVVAAGVWTVSACGSGDDSSGAASSSSGGDNGSTSSGGGSSSGSTSSSGGSSSGSTSSGSTSTSSGTASSSGGPNGATDPNLKVAFIGDTDIGTNFKNVLALVKAEKATMVMVQGDLCYNFAAASDWFTPADAALDDGTTRIPYFVSRGNHDWNWEMANGLGAGLDARLTKWGVTPTDATPSKSNYAVVYKGLSMVFVDESETTPTRADYVKARLQSDTHIWKICSFHKNMRASNVGPKSDEMNWTVYDNCRAAGAIVAQGHSHTYSRSKTLVNDAILATDATKSLDATCSDPFALCVGPNKHFFFDASLGGVDTRSLTTAKINGTPVVDMPHWAAKYTGDYGALFIEFNVDNDPKKARGYFKTIGGTVVDPPASSGKQYFTITAQ